MQTCSPVEASSNLVSLFIWIATVRFKNIQMFNPETLWVEPKELVLNIFIFCDHSCAVRIDNYSSWAIILEQYLNKYSSADILQNTLWETVLKYKNVGQGKECQGEFF